MHETSWLLSAHQCNQWTNTGLLIQSTGPKQSCEQKALFPWQGGGTRGEAPSSPSFFLVPRHGGRLECPAVSSAKDKMAPKRRTTQEEAAPLGPSARCEPDRDWAPQLAGQQPPAPTMTAANKASGAARRARCAQHHCAGAWRGRRAQVVARRRCTAGGPCPRHAGIRCCCLSIPAGRASWCGVWPTSSPPSTTPLST